MTVYIWASVTHITCKICFECLVPGFGQLSPGLAVLGTLSEPADGNSLKYIEMAVLMNMTMFQSVHLNTSIFSTNGCGKYTNIKLFLTMFT